jgi:hypothetical protein
MRLADTNFDNGETGCCARLDEKAWDDQEIEWKDKLFVKDHVRSFLHVPLNFGSVISRDYQLIEEAEAYPADPLVITDEVSPWGADLYVAVDREIPGATIEKISGKFLTKVFEGPYRNVHTWVNHMTDMVQEAGYALQKVYFYYATCPKCAKHFGKNQVVLLAQVGVPHLGRVR